ncbi:MAG: elements of external origin [Burkholderia sp.]|nr:elements of external origin [Burkholderia sp.]
MQIDGSDHAWFESRAPKCTLLVYVDDATSRLMYLHFTPSESTFSYFEATHAYLQQHGKPQTFYSDKAGIFRVNQKQPAGGDGYTQFGRALYELNIGIICANTSSAKGRVERAHLTLQDRLVKELRLEQISTMAAANAYAPTFIADYNRRFAKPPRNDFDAHRLVRHDEELDLIFTWREPRKVSHVLTLQYAKTMYLLADAPMTRKLIGKYIEVYEYPDGRIELRGDGIALPYYDRYRRSTRARSSRTSGSAMRCRWRNSCSSSATVGAAGRHRRTVGWHRRSITPPPERSTAHARRIRYRARDQANDGTARGPLKNSSKRRPGRQPNSAIVSVM